MAVQNLLHVDEIVEKSSNFSLKFTFVKNKIKLKITNFKVILFFGGGVNIPHKMTKETDWNLLPDKKTVQKFITGKNVNFTIFKLKFQFIWLYLD